MLEVFTVGGGEYLVNTFNAVAAWSGGGGYRSLLRVVMVMGLIYSLIVVAFTFNYKAWLNWFMGATMIYGCLMVPTVDIKVTDRINPSLAPATVANVPLGLGVLASFTTQIGDWLTRTAETVFIMPSELGYSTNGMVYGARLFDATRNFVIKDAEFSTNLEQHFKSCVFGDILLYRKSLTELARTNNLWAEIGTGSEARSQEWLERQSDGTVSSHVVTCRVAYQNLSSQWGPMIEANTPIWGKQVYPKLSNEAAASKLAHDVPVINTAFTGGGDDFVGVMRQNSAINAFMQARGGMAGSMADASIDTFAATRADIQARNTYNSIAQQAMAWVPILNIVLTVVFFAMFPVIFPLFLMPQTGVGALKGYAMGFFYLAAWGPLYVILHMICMTRAEAATTGIAAGGMTLGSYAGIGAVNGETATIAGFMLMSVPFLAAGLARGAMSIAGQSMSMLAPAQNAAEAAALEQTTGNYSYGNMSWSNATSNMRQSDQWTSAPSYLGGAPAMSWRTDNGALISNFGDGHAVYDTSAAISRLGFAPTMTSGAVGEWRQMASEAHRQAQAYENAASEILTATHTNRSAYGISTEQSSGWESGTGQSSNTSMEQFDRQTGSSAQSLEDRSSVGQSQRVSDDHSRRVVTTDTVSGRASASLGANGPRGNAARRLLGSLPSMSGEISSSGAQQDQLGHTTGQTNSADTSNTSSSANRTEHSNGSSASSSDGTYERAGTFHRASRSANSSTGTEDALSKARSYQETARKLEEMSRQLSHDASWAESHGMQLSTNLSQDLANWYRKQQSANPGLDAPEIWATDLTTQQQAVRSGMVQRWMSEKRDAIYAEIAQHLEDPREMTISRTGVSGSADVRAAYHPRGNAALPAAPDHGDRADANRIIQEGRESLLDTQSAAQASRSLNLEGERRVQQEVNNSLDRGFFLDPHLRK